MLSQALEEGTNRSNMCYQVGVHHNDIVKVALDLFQTPIVFIDNLDEPPR